MIKEAICDKLLCDYLADVGMPIYPRKRWFGKPKYECTLAQAMRWFRDKHDIHIEVHRHDGNTWSVDLIGPHLYADEKRKAYFPSYEYAAEFGLWLAIKRIGGKIHIEYD